ncbi:hypothetical protein M8A51_07410 [Schlegelella sp. S2-27]|uniref:Uncharacterized protein n=1 Tax=Caldimonas mangrovi TaxID=2944811 RepID=A0ABT0YKU6_9BURK|nr:hypothetical protein [Caldimonas mangrovi]MCM5679358.1 hypothetical protein [Caldimonas mangrovi]
MLVAGANVDRTLVLEALLATLMEVQDLMGQTCPPLGGTTVPINELPMFDSKVWPVAYGMVGEKLKVAVAVDINVFRQEKTKIPNTIDQTVTAILKAIQTKPLTPISSPALTATPALAKETA